MFHTDQCGLRRRSGSLTYAGLVIQVEGHARGTLTLTYALNIHTVMRTTSIIYSAGIYIYNKRNNILCKVVPSGTIIGTIVCRKVSKLLVIIPIVAVGSLYVCSWGVTLERLSGHNLSIQNP